MLEAFRDEIDELAVRVRAGRGRRRYISPELRGALGALARRVVAARVPIDDLAHAVGVTKTTLKKYLSTAETAEPGRTLVPVVVDVEPSRGTITLVAPSGWRLENVDAQTAITLLRELA